MRKINYSILASAIYRLAKILMASEVTKFAWNGKKPLFINENGKESMKAFEPIYNSFYKTFNKTLTSNGFTATTSNSNERGLTITSNVYKDEAGVEIKLNTIPFGNSKVITSVEIEDKKFIFTVLKNVKTGYDDDEITDVNLINTDYAKKLKNFFEEFKKKINEYMDTINSETMEGYEDNDGDSVEDRDDSDYDYNTDEFDEL